MTAAIDMAATVAPKSDQLNADDLIAGPRTITITRVTGNEGSNEQPVNVWFEGDNGKPFRPCKTVRRVMIQIWGPDAASYAGRSMTLYRDPDVTWGGMKVGGIRVSHMSHIDTAVTVVATVSKSSRKQLKIHPLPTQQPKRSAADFWSRGSLHIPIPPSQDGSGTDWPTWAGRIQRAASQAPDDAARTRLMADNGPALDGLRSHDETLYGAVMDALEPGGAGGPA